MNVHVNRAIVFSVLAALFYAICSPISKILLDGIEPDLLAALLYMGAGSGMLIVRSFSKNTRTSERELRRDDIPYIIAMIGLDIIAPILLMYGLLESTASSVSLLNNFEIVATLLIAMMIFGERVSKMVIVAIILITISAVILSIDGEALSLSSGSFLVIGACICWGLENNCTRRLSDTGATRLVVIKGLFSGFGALIIAVMSGIGNPEPPLIISAMILGFISYGLSLYFYISAQADLGAARVSAYYALAPFIGATLSMIALGEMPDMGFVVALSIMVIGTVLMTYDTLRDG